MRFYVYVHTNKINDKRYVGVTRLNLTTRWKNGKGYDHNKHLTSAVEKYGWENFNHQVFEVNSESEMFYLEKYLISFYDTTNQDRGYNHSIGGEGGNYKGIGSDGYKEYNKEYHRKWINEHKDKYSEYHRNYLKKWREEHPEKTKEHWDRSNSNRKLRQNNNLV